MFKKILLVDDSVPDTALTLHALTKCGIKNPVVYVGDATYGLLHLTDDPEIAIMLLDLHLQGASGFDLLKVIRANPQLAAMPVIIVTSSNEEADRVRANLLGASGYVVKPYELDQFADSLCTAIAPYRHLLEEAG